METTEPKIPNPIPNAPGATTKLPVTVAGVNEDSANITDATKSVAIATNPLTKDSEDDLYNRFRTATDEERNLVLEKLHEKLFRHGLAVAYIVLHEHRPDIAAAGCAEVICYPHRFKGQAKFTTYFEKIIRNMCRRALREKIADRANVPIEDIDIENNQFETDTQPKLYIDRISRDLDEESNQLLRLKLIGTPDAEIGEKLGINTEAVKSRWYRLKKTLAKQLGEER